jgi:hypothetical protein
LFLSEIEDIDLVVPFDTIEIGKHQAQHFGNYKKDSMFHQSALQTLVQQNVNHLVQNRNTGIHDMTDFLAKTLYPGSSIKISTA